MLSGATATADGAGLGKFWQYGIKTVLVTLIVVLTAWLTACGGGGGGGESGIDAGSGGGTGGGTGGGVTTYTISGTITPASLGASLNVALSGAGSATTTADTSGNYSFTGVANGTYTVTPSGGSALTFTPANRSITVNGANQTGAGFTASAGANVVFFDDFNGTSLSNAWTIIERRGPASQQETACNTRDAVSVSGGIVTITTSATPATCGDAVTAPSTLPYTTGDIQWTSYNFTYGTVEVRAKFPPQSTRTWPAIWMLGSNCQASNIVNGSEAVPFMGCPDQSDPDYRELDIVECGKSAWCQLATKRGSDPWATCPYANDSNWHVYKMVWNSSTMTVSVDGVQMCSLATRSITGPMFLIMQTQTSSNGGFNDAPNNALLPTTLQIDYVKVTQ